MYLLTTETTSKLSAALKEREAEVEALAKQNEDCDHEITRLQSQIQAFEEQLDRQQREFEEGEMAKTELVKQKALYLELQAENELLKRQTVPQALSPDLVSGPIVPGGSAGPSTISRNLGAEFARHLDDGEDDDPTMVETVTTTRTVSALRLKSQANSSSVASRATTIEFCRTPTPCTSATRRSSCPMCANIARRERMPTRPCWCQSLQRTRRIRLSALRRCWSTPIHLASLPQGRPWTMMTIIVTLSRRSASAASCMRRSWSASA